MWLPTPDAMVTRMLEMAKVGKGDLVYDLGAGEGRIPIAAAKAYRRHRSRASSTTRSSPTSPAAMRSAPASPTR